ncbi:hypothetical protein [Streptacidiphilus fuscans]|uniref:Nucleotidyltransferase domain-containing protein n=1 Tax=Streptacidiphilus fuscans TaxID=2789292 RepID=A0A931FE17_9ACTN|nr:hypothetical protein [Streptacidiphilus fuscans]MBF9070173.1 hypothetical protein [Streptacidiphilus fuscans]
MSALALEPLDSASATRIVEHCASLFEQTLADRLVAAYALGSLAHGGFAPAVSDIDLGLVLADRRDDDDETIRRVTRELQQKGSSYQRLSVFWSSLPALRADGDDGRFPAVDRLDLGRSGLLLLGEDVRPEVARPSAHALLTDGIRFALQVLAAAPVVVEFRDPARLASDIHRFTKAVLLPVRFLYTAATADIGSTDDAVERHLAQPAPVAADLVRAAMRARQGQPDSAEQLTELLRVELIPLYLAYIDGCLPALTPADGELAQGLTDWRTRLLNPA